MKTTGILGAALAIIGTAAMLQPANAAAVHRPQYLAQAATRAPLELRRVPEMRRSVKPRPGLRIPPPHLGCAAAHYVSPTPGPNSNAGFGSIGGHSYDITNMVKHLVLTNTGTIPIYPGTRIRWALHYRYGEQYGDSHTDVTWQTAHLKGIYTFISMLKPRQHVSPEMRVTDGQVQEAPGDTSCTVTFLKVAAPGGGLRVNHHPRMRYRVRH